VAPGPAQLGFCPVERLGEAFNPAAQRSSYLDRLDDAAGFRPRSFEVYAADVPSDDNAHVASRAV